MKRNNKELELGNNKKQKLAEVMEDQNIPIYAKTLIKQLSNIPSKDDILELIHEEKRKRTIVLTGLEEPNKSTAIERAKTDYESVLNLMDVIDIGQMPIATYRVGLKDPNKTRILKIEYPSSYNVWAIQKAKYKLKDDEKFKNIKIQNDMKFNKN